MVKYWQEHIDHGIKLTKIRIKYAEKHGMGAMAMEEKAHLKKQERTEQLRKEKIK